MLKGEMHGGEEKMSLLTLHDWEEKDGLEDDDHVHAVEAADADLLRTPEAQALQLAEQIMQSDMLTKTLAILKGVLSCLLPSFVVALWRPPPPRKPRYTAYLDGFRGAAAWTVYNYHLAYVLDKSEKLGWGYNNNNWEIYKLPLVRVLYSGSFSVSIFFVISGFALSIVPVLAMRKQRRDPGAFMLKLASAVLRRPLRLYLPSYVSSFIVFIAIRFNYFVYIQRHQRAWEPLVSGVWNWNMWPVRLHSFWDQLWDWTYKTIIWNTQYNGVLWTIRIEFYSSLALYLTHAALFPMSRPMRTVFSLALIVCFMIEGSWSMPLFWAGLILADHTQLTPDESLDISNTRPAPGGSMTRLVERVWPSITPTQKRILASVFPWCTFVLGLFLGSDPEDRAEGTPGFMWVTSLTPENYRQSWRFWYGVGAVLLLYSITRIPLLMRFFGSRFMQYTGRVSFSFYLVHGPIQHGVGRVIFYHCWRLTTKSDDVTAFSGFLLGYSILLLFTLWVADVFMRAVDEPVVNLGARIQKRLYTEL